MKRKSLALFLALMLFVTFFLGGCTPKNTETKEEPKVEKNVVEEPKAEDSKEETTEPLRIFALKGPTAMGLVKMFKDIDDKKEPYTYTIGNSPDEAIAALGGGKADIFMIPANMAAGIFQKNQNIQIAGINTLGVLYLASTGDEIKSLEELKGKTVYLAGKGATPEFAFKALCKKANLTVEDVTLEFKSEHGEVVQSLSQNPEGIGLLPQPFLTVAMSKNDKIHPVYDLNKGWKESFNGEDMITGVMVVTKELAEKAPEKVDEFLLKYKESVDFVNNNVEESGDVIGSYDIIPAPIAKKAIPQCNIVMIDGDKMEKMCDTYFHGLFEIEPKSVGGQVPNGEIYFR